MGSVYIVHAPLFEGLAEKAYLLLAYIFERIIILFQVLPNRPYLNPMKFDIGGTVKEGADHPTLCEAGIPELTAFVSISLQEISKKYCLS